MKNRWIILCIVMAFIYVLFYIKARENTDIILANMFAVTAIILVAIKDFKK